MILLHTGCRPNEAAFIVYNRSVEISTYHFKHTNSDWRATVPAEHTKTGIEYEWLLPNEIEYVIDIVRRHNDTGYDSSDKLREGLDNFYEKQILLKAGVPARDPKGKSYSMKAVRKFRATEWAGLHKEYEVMDWKPYPPNPLQHKSPKMTLAVYAEKGSDNDYKARIRCIEEYGADLDLRQPWMDNYTKRTGSGTVK